MKIVERGHVYQLDHLDNSGSQTVTFIKKEIDPENSEGAMRTAIEGTTNEEVLYMLLDRLEYLNEKFENHHNVNAIHHIKEALNELNMRTAERLNRGVEGKHLE